MFGKLAICMTDKCSAACDMCCFGCSPEGKMHLSSELMKDVIHQASGMEEYKAVGFTGGEPFLFYDQLVDCCAYAKSLGFHISVNSNGFWGRDEKRAAEMVRGLKEAGVGLIAFSTDRYHQQFVPIEYLRTALRVTYEAGLLSNVSVMETIGSDEIVGVVESLRPEVYHTEIGTHAMLPAGKAVESLSDDQFIKLYETREAKCMFVGMTHLNFDGNYYFCCSQFCREIPALNLGSAKEVRLKDILEKTSSNDYLYVMLRKGFAWYIDLAHKLGFEIPEYACTPCHCYRLVLGNQEFCRKAEDYVKDEAGQLRVQHLLKI